VTLYKLSLLEKKGSLGFYMKVLYSTPKNLLC